VLDLEPRLRCRKCEARGKAVISIQAGRCSPDAVPSSSQRVFPRAKDLDLRCVDCVSNTMGCQIVDMSDTGAKLVPADIFLCPSEFVLRPQIGEPRHCEVAWRRAPK
jgi:hypothetical protein